MAPVVFKAYGEVISRILHVSPMVTLSTSSRFIALRFICHQNVVLSKAAIFWYDMLSAAVILTISPTIHKYGFWFLAPRLVAEEQLGLLNAFMAFIMNISNSQTWTERHYTW